MFKLISFTKVINASPEKVWDVLWTPETYNKWTSVFSEGSKAEGTWEQGSIIRFLDGKGNGVYAIVETNNKPSTMVFRHQGEISNGEEKEGSWKGAVESYELRSEAGTTILKAEMDTTEEMQKYFDEKMPQALEIVKQLAEQ